MEAVVGSVVAAPAKVIDSSELPYPLPSQLTLSKRTRGLLDTPDVSINGDGTKQQNEGAELAAFHRVTKPLRKRRRLDHDPEEDAREFAFLRPGPDGPSSTSMPQHGPNRLQNFPRLTAELPRRLRERLILMATSTWKVTIWQCHRLAHRNLLSRETCEHTGSIDVRLAHRNLLLRETCERTGSIDALSGQNPKHTHTDKASPISLINGVAGGSRDEHSLQLPTPTPSHLSYSLPSAQLTALESRIVQ
ncbi:hypothetical protein JB92DRAFT_1391767 [Gautieria morchelliformis]|nr:hypothetical protein JB92DRAFT_1391767 [Gautieria morchelliformis]